MRKIKLTRNKYALVDNEDYEFLNQWKWHVHFDGFNFYAKRNVPASENSGKRTTVTMHIVLLGKKTNKEIDHIDGNGLNNQRKNLRLCTHSENGKNRLAQSNNKSGFIGVSFHKASGKWRAYGNINKKPKHIGLYDDILQAVSAFNEFSRDHYKEFRRVKFMSNKKSSAPKASSNPSRAESRANLKASFGIPKKQK